MIEAPIAPPAATTEPVTAPAEVVKTFTQEQVNAFVQQRLSEDRSRRPAAVAPQEPVEKATKADLQSQIEEMKLRGAFDKRAGKFDLDDKASDRLFNLFKAERPEDPTAWFSETAAQFGLKGHNVNTNAPTPGATAAPAPPASAPSAPAKVDPMTSSGLVDNFNLSPQQFDQLGPAGLRTHFEKILSVGHQMQGAPRQPQMTPRK